VIEQLWTRLRDEGESITGGLRRAEGDVVNSWFPCQPKYSRYQTPGTNHSIQLDKQLLHLKIDCIALYQPRMTPSSRWRDQQNSFFELPFSVIVTLHFWCTVQHAIFWSGSFDISPAQRRHELHVL
jgi:hypothetical protein